MPTRILSLTLAAAVVMAAVQPTTAWARHGDPYGHWRGLGPHHHGHHPGFHGRHVGFGGHWRSSGHDVWAPLIVGGLIGAAVVGVSRVHAQPAPATVFVPLPPASHLTPAPVAPPLLAPTMVVPPVVVPPVVAPPPPTPPRVHYYCAPYRAYFPNVGECPSPWTLVPY